MTADEMWELVFMSTGVLIFPLRKESERNTLLIAVPTITGAAISKRIRGTGRWYGMKI